MNYSSGSEDLLYRLACECEGLFDQLHEAFLGTKSEIASIDLCAEFQQRFAIWTAHLGVFSRKSQCLDTRLKGFPDLQDLAARLLDILRRNLQQWKFETTSLDEDPASQTTLRALDDTLSRLNRLGLTIRQSSNGKMDIKTKKFAAGLNLKPFAYLCAEAVQALYPSAHPSLKDYLSKSMTDRYARILFLNSRHKKLQARREPSGTLPSIPEAGNDEMQTNLSITQPTRVTKNLVVTGLPRAPSQSDLTSVDIKRIKNRNKPPDEASTKLHRTLSIRVNQGHYPRPAGMNEDSGIFCCEWCSEQLSKKTLSENEWRQHMDRDLKPYVCLSEACEEADPVYPTFDEWFRHMELHNRRWYRKVYLTSSWSCGLCEFNPDVYSSPLTLYSHLEKSHGGDFTNEQLQAIARQCKTEQPRTWNDCLLCCFSVGDQGNENEAIFPKRRKGLQHPQAVKRARQTLEMSNPDPHSSETELSDTDSDSDGTGPQNHESQRTRECSKATARHIAAHLQVLMLLTLRLAALQNADGDLCDDIKSDSVDIDEGNNGAEGNDLGRLSDVASQTDVTTNDVDDAENAEDDMDLDDTTVEDDVEVPDAKLDLQDVPRQYDNLAVEDDHFLKKVVESGAYQNWRHEGEKTPKLSAYDYTIGWVCSIEIEYLAAKALLDEKHEIPESLLADDTSTYTLGKIGKHNVVIAALLPHRYGIEIPRVVRNMIQRFPNVGISLMVGIGGGVQSHEYDIRLGDVVVGFSENGKGGVLQYDLGKTMQKQELKLEEPKFLSLPPKIVRTAVAQGRMSQHKLEGRSLNASINESLTKDPGLHKRFQRPEATTDRLYEANVVHTSNSSCAISCGDDPSALVSRPNRTGSEDSPSIHFGLIVSTGMVLRDAMNRDVLAAEIGALCFDTAAHGFMDDSPCLVVRGICDYSDSHKSKEWQGYAAMSAAAYAKQLLYRMPQVEAGTLSDYPVFAMQYSRVLFWLTPHNYDLQQNAYFGQREPETGQWFFETNEFSTWRDTCRRTLFCPGIPGSGKTILTSIVVEHLKTRFQDDKSGGIAYVYCDFQRQDEQTPRELLASILKQLIQSLPGFPQSMKSLCEKYKGVGHPSLEEISMVLQSTAKFFSRVFVLIDALDECQESDGNRIRFLAEVFKLQTNSTVNIFATSRLRDLYPASRKLQHAVAIEVGTARFDLCALPEIEGTISACAGLVMINNEEDTVCFVHYPAQRYFDNRSAEWLLNSESYITKACVTYLSFEVFKGGFCRTDEEFEERINLYPFYDYAAHHWGIHANETTLLCEEVIEFLEAGPELESSTQALLVGNRSLGREYSQKFPRQMTGLHLAALFGIRDGVEILIGRTVVDSRDSYGRTALFYAIGQRHEAIVELLLNTGKSNADAKDQRGRTPLSCAVEQGNAAIVKLILDTDRVDVNVQDEEGWRPLSLAVEKGNAAVLKLLLDTGKVVMNAKDRRGRTPLSRAAEQGYGYVVRLLLDTGKVDINAQDSNGDTPLFMAMREGHSGIVKLFFDRGAVGKAKESAESL
ncbi:hypothetical protein AK830_g6898 [Neonectria ditissima]|uniref:Nephrocystin 3-like N-terminal domain-containing protein n=1 Tax=Neonectria ditissima TaxID=78410 RepID=A0A0P7AP77_9HYPO|nr:hypothetical protein AK830_g6898 [Neonectria ditissima]